MSFQSINNQPVPNPTGNLGSSTTAPTPGVNPGPFSPGEPANAFLTPDCPATEGAINQMQK